MKNKLIAIIILISCFACVDQYEIDSQSDAPYDSYANLGFEDGLEHWHGQANTFSSISIDSDAYEGVNSLNMAIRVDASLLTESTEPSVVEISKSLDVLQGDTISISYQLSNSNNGALNNIDLLNTSIFHDKDGFVIHSAVPIKTSLSPLLQNQKILECSRKWPIMLMTLIFSLKFFLCGYKQQIPLMMRLILTPFWEAKYSSLINSGSTKEFIFAIISAFPPSSACLISLLMRNINFSLRDDGDTNNF